MGSRSKHAAAGALSLGTALFGWWSCSSDERAEESDAGTDAGGAAGTGAAGGGSGAGGLPTGGVGGTGGTGGAAGFGASPKWEATTAVVDGCPIERLANAKELKVFQWEPCAWSPSACEQGVFNPNLLSIGDGWNAEGFIRTSVVHDDGEVTRVGLAIKSATTGRTVYALEDGHGLDGFRVKNSTASCSMHGASVWGDRFAVKVRQKSKEATSGMVGKLGDPAQPIAFQHASQPPGGSQGYVLGSERWVWWWAPAYAYTSVSALDGSDYQPFAETAFPNGIVYLGEPITTGKTFLFQAFVGDDAGAAQGKIMWSDGVAAPAVYLEPPDPNDAYGSPIFANSHFAYFRGLEAQDTNKFQSVELWSSPYSDDPKALQPKKLDTLSIKSIPTGQTGGWGFAAFPSYAPEYGDRELVIWNLATGTKQLHLLPETYDLVVMLGISRTHLWIGAAKFGTAGARYLVRIKLQ